MLCVRRWKDARQVQYGQVHVLACILPRAQNRACKMFKSITKTIHFVHLVILFIYKDMNILLIFLLHEVGFLILRLIYSKNNSRHKSG